MSEAVEMKTRKKAFEKILLQMINAWLDSDLDPHIMAGPPPPPGELCAQIMDLLSLSGISFEEPLSDLRAEAGRIGGLKSGETRRSKTKQNEANSLAVLPEKITPDWVVAQFKHWEQVNAIYRDVAYLEREVRKMSVWLSDNRHKIPKAQRGWTRFVSGWLERGWEQYRRSLTSQKPIEEDFLAYYKRTQESEARGDAGGV